MSEASKRHLWNVRKARSEKSFQSKDSDELGEGVNVENAEQ